MGESRLRKVWYWVEILGCYVALWTIELAEKSWCWATGKKERPGEW